MIYNAENGNIKIDGTDMDYVSFGKGERSLVIIHGLGDGLKTVKGAAAALAVIYREYADDFKVHIFSRKNHLEPGYTTRDMARDYVKIYREMGIAKTDIIGISLGGMISQHLALDYPQIINKLVLVVTLSRPNETVRTVLDSWLKLAEADNYKDIFIDTAEKAYTEKRLKILRPLYPMLGKIGIPTNLNRYIVQANAGFAHNTYEELDKIKCPTMVIGACNDMVTGPNTSEEIAGKIENSKLVMYEGYGHGVYEEADGFHKKVKEFLLG